MDVKTYMQIRGDYYARSGLIPAFLGSDWVWSPAELRTALALADAAFKSVAPVRVDRPVWELSREEWEEAFRAKIIRLKSEGYSGVPDDCDITEHIAKAGGRVISDAPAEHTGTLYGQMREVVYELEGQIWYAYVVPQPDYQDWVVSKSRITEDEAVTKYVEAKDEFIRIPRFMPWLWEAVHLAAKDAGLI